MEIALAMKGGSVSLLLRMNAGFSVSPLWLVSEDPSKWPPGLDPFVPFPLPKRLHK